MSKNVFISHSYESTNRIDEIFEPLRDAGFDFVSWNTLTLGESLYTSLFELMRDADYFIVFLDSDKDKESANQEINRILGYTKGANKPIITVRLDKSEIPHELRHVLYFDASEKTNDEISAQLLVQLQRLHGEQEAEAQKVKERIRKFEGSLSNFIEPTIADLQLREQRLRKIGGYWNLIGFMSIIVGVIASLIIAIRGFYEPEIENITTLIMFAFKGGILLALLLSSSKYAFNIAKSYINESLKVADRIHAISFGKFYLKVFEADAKPSDFKEIFRDWNFTKESSFSSIKSENYDPRIIESVTKLIEQLKELK